jgi:DNA polymerase III alpha subunit
MDEQSETIEMICRMEFEKRGMDDSLKSRLDDELREVLAQSEDDYLLDLYHKKVKFAVNENNLLVVYLLGLVDAFDVKNPPRHIDGEFPDIDQDYLPEIQQHIKNVWAPRTFGVENVCSIGTYGTLGIKMALKDVTRVFGIPRDEVDIICKNIPDKDDDGKELEWEKAQELCPDLKDYCSRYPEIAEAVQILIHRRKSGGVHAGGLIISSKPITDFVPLEVRSVKKDQKYGIIASAWGEGLHSQDLGAVGLVKFDLLVVDGLYQTAIACKLIKERHGVDHICAKPGQRNWSDTSYLNDEAALAIIRKGDTKCIFQFGSEGIRKMVRRGGVDSFNDIAAYSALYRPGCMTMKMHDAYCNRKRGEEHYTLHPLVRPILKSTYGVMLYQEQIMKMLNVVGGIPEMHCEIVRKAISKKKIEYFAKYEPIFLKNAQANLGVDEEYVKNLWDQVVAFSGYGFNRSHSVAYSFISSRQLWLMAYYPLEFYASVLMCEKDNAKIKEIKIDASMHNIEVAPIHINKSKANFSIQMDDDGKEKIFYGFSNLQTIGENPAKRIIENQPYASFEDFLQRFGADGHTIKALVSLNAFRDDNRLKLFKFAEHWKDWHKKQHSSKKRFGETLIHCGESLKDLLAEYRDVVSDPIDYSRMGEFDEHAYELWEKYFSHIEEEQPFNYKGEVRTRTITVLKKFQEIRRRRENSITGRATKDNDVVKDGIPTLARFDLHRNRVKVDPDVEQLMSGDTREAEKVYYGYQWIHKLEKSPDYQRYTIDSLTFEKDEPEFIEVMLQRVEQCKSKKSDTIYYVLHVEDANGREIMITMWEDDYARFQDDLKPENLLRISVKPPEGNWAKWSFKSVPRHLRRTLARHKDDDDRLYVMREPISNKETVKPKTMVEILMEDI